VVLKQQSRQRPCQRTAMLTSLGRKQMILVHLSFNFCLKTSGQDINCKLHMHVDLAIGLLSYRARVSWCCASQSFLSITGETCFGCLSKQLHLTHIEEAGQEYVPEHNSCLTDYTQCRCTCNDRSDNPVSIKATFNCRVSPTGLADRLTNGALPPLLIDVRPRLEFELARLAGI